MPKTLEELIISLKMGQMIHIVNALQSQERPKIKKFATIAVARQRVAKHLAKAIDIPAALAMINKAGIQLVFKPETDRAAANASDAEKAEVSEALGKKPASKPAPARDLKTERASEEKVYRDAGVLPKAPRKAGLNSSILVTVEEGPKKKQTAPPHLNLRCPLCGYYAKSIPSMLAKGRLKCPVHPAQNLETAEERHEKRGRY